MGDTSMQDVLVLSTVTFQLERAEPQEDFQIKKQFPVAIPPKEKTSIGEGGSNITFAHTETFGSEPTFVYVPQNNVSRPRNKFIIARTMLSKVVKSHFPGSTYDVSRIISKIWGSCTGRFQRYFNYLSFLDSEWHDCYYPLYQYTPKAKNSGPKMVGRMVYGNNLLQKNVSVVLLKDPDNKVQQQKVTTASDIRDMTNYVSLCTSSFEDGTPVVARDIHPAAVHDSAAYKEHTLTFSINGKPAKQQATGKKTRTKVTKWTKSKDSNHKKNRTMWASIDLVFTKFKSPLYGEVEDVCINPK